MRTRVLSTTTDWRTRLATLDGAACLVALAFVLLVAIRSDHYQWDFQMFRWSADDFVHGVSPYKGKGLSFYHPPLTLYVYRTFLALPRPLACEVWYALKLAALVALVASWRRRFVRLHVHGPTILYFLLAFNAAIYADLVSGNVSIFEQLALWLGFEALLGERYLRFALLLIIVSQIKLIPIFFALLLLIVPVRPRWGWFGGTVLGFGALFLMNAVLQPELLRQFFRASASLDEGICLCNASTLTLIRDVLDRLTHEGHSAQTHVDELIFCVFSALACAASLAVVARYRRNGRPLGSAVLIYFACALLTIIAPRMKVYSYVLLLVPALHLVRMVRQVRTWTASPARVAAPAAVLAMLLIFPQPSSSLPMPIRVVFELFHLYMPLIAAFLVWLGYARVLARGEWPRTQSEMKRLLTDGAAAVVETRTSDEPAPVGAVHPLADLARSVELLPELEGEAR